MLRRFNHSDIKGAARLALECFRPGSPASGAGFEDCIAVRINADEAEDLLDDVSWRESPCNAQAAKAAFAGRLARSADARLRRAAAQLEDLPADAARRLAADPAASVRQNLAQTSGALRRLSAEECLALAGGDAGFAKSIMTNLAYDAEDALRSRAADADELAEKAEAVIAAFRDVPDPGVRADAKTLAGELEAARRKGADAEGGEAPVGARGLRIRRFFRDKAALDAAEGGFGFALAFIAEGGDLECEPQIDSEAPVLRLGPEGAARAARRLRAEDPKAAEMTARLAQSAFAQIRAAAAGAEAMSREVAEALVGDTAYEVRLAAASNDAFLDAVSTEKLVGMIAGDPELLEQILWRAKPALVRELKKVFSRSPDPALAELAAGCSN